VTNYWDVPAKKNREKWSGENGRGNFVEENRDFEETRTRRVRDETGRLKTSKTKKQNRREQEKSAPRDGKEKGRKGEVEKKGGGVKGEEKNIRARGKRTSKAEW